MVHHQAIITLMIAIFVASSKANESSQCTQTCKPNKGNENRVPYPFGFSDGCHIRLTCSDNGEAGIAGYRVQNITAESLLIKLPAKCNRRIGEIKPLFTANYALTLRNGLMLQNCSSMTEGCVIPTTMVETKFGFHSGCGLENGNISCYSPADKGSNFMNYEDLNQTGCQILYTSIAVDDEISNSDKNSSVSLQFQVAELEWWVKGHCQCSRDANCTVVKGTGARSGFRCRCKEGFEGDGFIAGTGCRKVPNCSAFKHLVGQCGGMPRVGVLIGGIIAGATLVAALSFMCCFIRRRSTSFRNQMSTRRLLFEAAGGSSVPFFPYKEIDKATNNFSDKQRLGTGAYGTVYAGKLYNDEWVAIKKIRHRDTDSVEQVMNEIKLLSSVSHPNLVRLLGCCIDNGEQILVYEFMPNGTLSQHLQRERGRGLPWTTRLTIASETAHAIAYLHNAINPPIYHRDIKSSNILLDHKFKSKVADFGLSRLGMTDDYSHISTAPQGTPGYVDPQYHQNFHLSDKSDVYSFGVVLIEIITAMKVVDFSRAHSEVNLAALAIDRIGKGRLDEIIDPFLEPNRDAWTLASIHKVAELAFRCLAFHKDMRPSMMEVAEELEQIRVSSWETVDESICIASSAVSASSSPYKKVGVGSKKLIIPQRLGNCLASSREELKDGSPVSVQDPWLSAESSPSTNSLLGNAAQ
ncbi:Non-specific serine/threonine protein kinase [Bertholletia excelsa]